jgi:uncharacterized NAD-dependent epimerase/dehydratase family protein
MEDVVAIAATNRWGEPVAFITWGRIYGSTEAQPILAAVKRCAKSCEGAPMKGFRMCRSLSEASKQLYFYEALITFAMKPILFGSRYSAWREKKRRAIEQGREIYFLPSRTGIRRRAAEVAAILRRSKRKA